ncbi:alpha/beta fold hydrolase [Solimonas marina]|uniref:Alpha/beta fold hydrolase n=1 Tax=Solimonas marina TaxID=2714601 RepID=A0A969WBQ4_9GAMM|nr:alpha/beta hydrolase [Solimonas marina]NKF24431.1 alpha/beta fold hydrolase [Solimonas marina]
MPSVRIDDVELHYTEVGAGTPLLLVHGLGGSYLDWEHQIPYFARHYRVIAPDLRGFGDSDTGRRLFSIERFARDVIGLADALGLRRFLLVGHSMGGAVAQQLTLDNPGRVRKLVVANSMPLFQPQTRRHYIEFAYRWVVMGLLGPARLARIGANRMYPGDEQAAAREASAARGMRTSRYSYLAALAALGRWSVLERLGELRMPVLVVASENDYYTHEESVQFAHALPRGRLHTVKAAHHGLPAEKPAIFNDVVARFLRAPHKPLGAAHGAGERREAAAELAHCSPDPAPMPDALLGE